MLENLSGYLRDALLPRPFPPEWRAYVHANVPMVASLSPPMRDQVCELVPALVTRVEWKGCGGLRITDEVRVTIAAQACLLVAFQTLPAFVDLDAVHVYPGQTLPTALVGDKEPGELVPGATSAGGPVLLAWDSVLLGCRGLVPENVVIHELAHKLDYADARFDGIPATLDAADRERWDRISRASYRRHVELSAARAPLITPRYAATNRGEFFACLTEVYFTYPDVLEAEYPAMFELLRALYRPGTPDG